MTPADLSHPLGPQSFPASRIVLIYLVAATLWILFSDQLLIWLVPDPLAQSALQTVKGWLFVLVTSGLLLLLIRRQMSRLEQANRALQQLIAGASVDIGEDFFRSLTRQLAEVSGQQYAMVSLYDADSGIVRPVVAVGLETVGGSLDYPIAGTPSEQVLLQGPQLFPRNVRASFPADELLQRLEIESYAGHPLQDTNGHVIGLLCAFSRQPLRDPRLTGALLRIFASRTATELRRHQAEERRKAAESRFRHVVEATSDAILAVDDQLRLILVNAGAEGMLGYGRNELFFRELSFLLPLAGATELLATCRATLASSQPDGSGTLLFSVRKKQGELVPVEATLSRADSADGPILTLVLRDISRRLEQERNRREQFQQFSTIFDSMNAAVAVSDLHSNTLLYLNRKGEEVFGAAAQGRTRCAALGCDDTQSCGVCLPDRLLQDGRPAEPTELEFQHPRTGRWYRCLEKAVDWVDGRTVRLSILIDVQNRREMEQMKNRMLAALGHEMRTPLTTLLGYTDLMLTRETEAENRRQYLLLMQQEGERLDRLINNFVTLQRLTVAPEAQQLAVVQLEPLLRNVVQLLAGQSPAHRLQLRCPEPLPPVLGMAEQLQEVLFQLATNAIRFSPGGGEVVLGAVATAEQVILSVQDHGVGIPTAEQERIFDQFYRSPQADASSSGIGLGLALARKITELHHGRIWVESTPGQGSTFYVTLPVATAAEMRRSAPL